MTDAVCLATGIFTGCLLYPILKDGAHSLYWRWRKWRIIKDLESLSNADVKVTVLRATLVPYTRDPQN